MCPTTEKKAWNFIKEVALSCFKVNAVFLNNPSYSGGLSEQTEQISKGIS